MGNEHAILIGFNAPEVFGVLAILVVGAVLFVMLLVPFFKGVGWVMRQIFQFITGEIGDAFRLVGAFLLGIVYLFLIVGSVLIARWSAASHFGRALQSECATGGACIYRLIVGNPVRLFGLSGLTEGFERRLPEVVRAVPSGEATASRTGQFEGYKIVGTLPGGGSGAKLYIAVPDSVKAAAFARSRMGPIPQVVIKCFTLGEGSSLNQIVRESRSLEAAKRLGLILDDELSQQRFYYVTRYVPGESLSVVTRRLHGISGPGGLGDSQLRSCMGYASDLLRTLTQYHRGGLWHKDVKPDNIIVDGGPGAAAHLVDFGLVSSLRSAMTLTTHGTEYFRDPELVRQALKGVKVHEVDGTRFDVYAAGAVLFSMMEDSFPAHGVLSQVTKRCPDAIKWIIRRAMTDYDKRYMSAEQMLADLRVVAAAPDPFAVKPVELPSMTDGWQAPAVVPDEPRVEAFAASPVPPRAAAAAGVAAGVAGVAGVGAAAAGAAGGVGRSIPRMKVANWWTGRVEAEAMPTPGAAQGPFDVGSKASEFAERSVRTAREVLQGAMAGVRAGLGKDGGQQPAGTPWTPPSGPRKTAAAQLASARARVHSARERARQRANTRMGRTGAFKPRGNVGVAVAVVVFMLVVVAIFGSSLRPKVVTVPPVTRTLDMYINGVQASAPQAGDRSAGQHTQAQPQSLRLVVVNDLRPPWTPAVSKQLHSIADSLSSHGVAATGVIDDATVGKDEVNLIANAKMVLDREQLHVDSGEAFNRYVSWFSSTTDNIDGVLWIEPPLDPSVGQPRLFLFTPGSATDGERTGVIVEALRQALGA